MKPVTVLPKIAVFVTQGSIETEAFIVRARDRERCASCPGGRDLKRFVGPVLFS